jgi:hypothetical protein
VITAFRIIDPIGGVFHFRRCHGLPSQRQFIRNVSALGVLRRSKAGRDRRDTQATVDPEYLVRDRSEKSGICSPAEGDDDGFEIRKDPAQSLELDVDVDLLNVGLTHATPSWHIIAPTARQTETS